MKLPIDPFGGLVRNEDGQDMIEYALLAAFVALAAAAILVVLGPAVAGIYQRLLGFLQKA